jgi:hypothetical protein
MTTVVTAYNTLHRLLDIFHLMNYIRYNTQDSKLSGKYRVKQPHVIQLNMNWSVLLIVLTVG